MYERGFGGKMREVVLSLTVLIDKLCHKLLNFK